MAKRRGRKSQAEMKVERITWMLMVGVFAVIYIAEDQAFTIPNPFVPFAGAVILLGAALYQYGQRWHVSPTTWIAGTAMLMLAIYNVTVDGTANFFGVTLLIFAGVIGVGVITGET
jgi:hypothetical protein